MSLKNNLENFKNKKLLIEELNYYKSIILKKIKDGEYNSALEKVRSALVLLEEHKDYFNIEKEIRDFYELNEKVKDELFTHRIIYERRFKNLLKEKLSETNLEDFTKLLAMLKSDVDQNVFKYNLQDISLNITKYFKFIKKMYEILSCYKVLNYHDASDKIFEFVREIRTENFPNLKRLISLTYQNLVRNRLFQCSKEYEKLSISALSKRLAMDQEQLIEFINLIQKQPKSPIQNYFPKTQEIIFKK
ncbi:MAG: type II toxin-antitoxin system ParD family antitoxin [Promethearchaeota archaeon]